MKFPCSIFFILCTAYCAEAQITVNRTLLLMGSRFDLSVVAKDSAEGNQYIDTAIEEIQRIEKLISSWNPNSQTSMINENAGIKPIQVDRELWKLINRSLAISALTDGAFDVSFAPLAELWKFDGSMTEIPSSDEIALAVSKVDYRKIILDENEHTVFLKEKGMKIGFGAIGKGYAADMAKSLLVGQGVSGGIINAAGDLTTWGVQPNSKPWKVAVTNPLNKNKVFAMLPMTNGSLVTSGDYEKYVEINGKRYSHIIDPRTGYPSSGVISASVLTKKAELADALATALFVMGGDVGLDRINQLADIECILVDDQGAIHTSRNIDLTKP